MQAPRKMRGSILETNLAMSQQRGIPLPTLRQDISQITLHTLPTRKSPFNLVAPENQSTMHEDFRPCGQLAEAARCLSHIPLCIHCKSRGSNRHQILSAHASIFARRFCSFLMIILSLISCGGCRSTYPQRKKMWMPAPATPHFLKSMRVGVPSPGDYLPSRID